VKLLASERTMSLVDYIHGVRMAIREEVISARSARRAAGPKHSAKRRAQWRAYKATVNGAASRRRYERSERGCYTRATYDISPTAWQKRCARRIAAMEAQLGMLGALYDGNGDERQCAVKSRTSGGAR